MSENKYAGTQTEKNLEAAFAGESQARNKYTYFASVAKKEGYEQIADLFLKTANNEKEHAKMWFKELQGIGDTAQNLAAAADGENYEWTDMYDGFAKTAEEEEKEIRPSIPTCEIGRWYPAFADVTAKGDTKQKGIDEIIRYFDIKLEETMSFGDGGNDISMLRHAAIGVAMGQAKEDVKAAADYVTAPIDEDGISKAMKHFGII